MWAGCGIMGLCGWSGNSLLALQILQIFTMLGACSTALETLRNQLSIRQMFLEMPMEDLRSDLWRIVQLQRAIVLVLRIVEETASAILHILVDREAQEEEVASLVDEVVDVGYGVDDGEDFDFDGNNVDS